MYGQTLIIHRPEWIFSFLATNKRKFMLKKYVVSIKANVRGLFWILKRYLKPPCVPVNDDGKTLLHLGCGPIDARGFVNVDLQPFPHVHHVSGAFPLDMFPSECADLVYASHILEHFSWTMTLDILKEWQRVLKPGGVLRLGVPDFPTIISIYLDTGDIGQIHGPLMGGQSYPHNFHYAVFDEERLRTMLIAAGFRHVRCWDPAAAPHHSFRDTTSNVWKIRGKDYAISLNLEAVK